MSRLALFTCTALAAALPRVAWGQPQISVTPSTLDYGLRPLGSSPTSTLTIRNGGQSDLAISAITIRDPYRRKAFFLDPASPMPPLVIERQHEVMLKLAFRPPAVGSFPAEIEFESNDPGQRSLRVTLDGRGVQPDWTASPRALAFRTLLIDQQSTELVTLTNTSQDLAILANAARIEGPGADQFRVKNPEPVSLAPHQSVTYLVTCRPRAPGQHVASLVLEAGKGPVSIALTATAAAATLAHPTVDYSFGDVAVGSTSKPREFPLALVPPGLPQHIIAIESDNPSLFAVDLDGTLLDLNPGEATSIRVRFSPGAAGEAVARITATVSGGLGPLVVARLHGRGVAGVPALDTTCAVAGGGPGRRSGSGSGGWPVAGAMVWLALRSRRRQ